MGLAGRGAGVLEGVGSRNLGAMERDGALGVWGFFPGLPLHVGHHKPFISYSVIYQSHTFVNLLNRSVRTLLTPLAVL